MKIIKYNTIPVGEEIPFDIEHLKDIFEDLTQNFDKVDFTDKEILDEIKQLPKLYTEWYSKDEFCQCKEKVNEILDILCTKYSIEDILTCIDQYFGR